MRAVLDTNVWLSAFLTPSPTSAARLIWDAWRNEIFEVVVSHAIVNEVADKLLELRYDRSDVEEFVTLLYGLAQTVAIEHQVMGCRDPEDDPFLRLQSMAGLRISSRAINGF